LLSDRLESAYGEGNSEYAKQIVSEVKFYLRRKNIDVVDYDGDNRAFFDLMPSEVSGTIRPALVIAGSVLRKCLAAGE
ncbi:MAG: hypothetical protein IJI77_04900, partial [Erysipelotrichaceae bacterium]|nr:hypothetical protein [Erysipelotrichaceae bacterium]